MSKGEQLKLQRSAATKAEGEQRSEGGKMALAIIRVLFEPPLVFGCLFAPMLRQLVREVLP